MLAGRHFVFCTESQSKSTLGEVILVWPANGEVNESHPMTMIG